MGQGQALTDAQLQELASDPQFSEADRALLTPSERTRLAAVQSQGTMMGKAKGVVRGVVKGAGETAFKAGSVVHNTPGVGDLTDLLSRMVAPTIGYAMNGMQSPDQGADAFFKSNPDAAFSQTPRELEANGTAEAVGKGLEQAGEFFIPAGPTRMAAIERLVKFIPNATPAVQMKILNKLAALTGRVAGEGASATGVAALHGDEDPQTEGKAAAIATGTGEGLAGLMNVLKTQAGKKLGPFFAAMTAMNAGSKVLPKGLGSQMGAFGLLKGGAKSLIEDPGKIRTGQKLVKSGANLGGRATAAGIDHVRLQKRRLKQEEDDAYGRSY